MTSKILATSLALALTGWAGMAEAGAVQSASTPQEIMPSKLINSLQTGTPVKLDFEVDHQPKPAEPAKRKTAGAGEAETKDNETPVDLQPDPKNGSEAQWQQLFQSASNKLAAKTQGMVKIIVMDTDNQATHQFIWQSILKASAAKTEMDEMGLAGTYVVGNIINGAVEPTCYVLYRYQKSRPVEQQFSVPLSKAYSQEIAADFLMGHEVAHCFDFRSRLEAMHQQKYWTESGAATIGIAPVAFQRYFGGVMDYQLYEQQSSKLAQDPAQRQYQEELADIFGVFWAWTEGMPESGLDIIVKARKLFPDTSPHGTWFALEDLGRYYQQVMSYQGDLQSLWLLATHIQAATGVSLALRKGTGDSKKGGYLAGLPKQGASPINFSNTPVFGQVQDRRMNTVIEHTPSKTRVVDGSNQP